MSVFTHQEKQTNDKTARGMQEKRENKPILKRLRVTLLWLFRGLHGKKMVCVRGVPGVPGTIGKANNHFNPTQMGLGTAPPQ